MADNGAIGQFTDEIEQTASEVASDVKDSFGEMVEQGVQAITGGPQLTPQQIQQKQVQDQAALAEVRRKIKFRDDLKVDVSREAQLSKEKETQRLQSQQQEVSDKKIEKVQIQGSSKKPGANITEEIARTRQEIGKGHGVGG